MTNQNNPGDLPPLPDPYAVSVTWRNKQGGSWRQWHDIDEPVPSEWAGRPPDDVVRVYTEDQMHAHARAAVAQAMASTPLKDAQIDAAIDGISIYAMSVDIIEYGLPIHDDHIPAMREIVRRAIAPTKGQP